MRILHTSDLHLGRTLYGAKRDEAFEKLLAWLLNEIKDKNVIMIDDIIDTAGTISNGAAALVERGAKSVYVSCTHAILSGPAYERLANAPIKEIVTTNTIPATKEFDKLTVLSVAPLMGEAILRIHNDASVSEMFD